MTDLVGSQKPSFMKVPAREGVDVYDGQDFVDLADAFGLKADPWQELIVEEAMARDEVGELVSRIVALSVPRQNGKNGAIEVLELGQMVLLGRRILHTAHEVKTGRKAFLRLLEFFESHDELGVHVKQVRKVNGQEAIFLSNGASCEFIARSKSSGRGFSVDTLVMDEAQELSEESLAALLPTISASSSPQQIITGTPPSPMDVHGEAFRRFHDSAHEGSELSLLWLEWSADPDPGEVELDADDEVLWFKANPALGQRITIDAVRTERAAMDDATFRRERLGLWERERTARVLPLEDWQACADPNLEDDGEPVVMAVDVSLSRDSASIVASGVDKSGRFWVDVVENRRGTPDWVVPRLLALLDKHEVRAVMIDVLSPAGSLVDPLEASGVKISRVGSNILASGCGQFFDAVMSHDLRHLDQMSLNVAVAAARKRKLGDSWAWNRAHGDADVTPLVAATLALVGRTYSKAKRPVRKKRERRKVLMG